eukprot:GEMP01047264.1.p1 GENE.GEMP01047264.1~~GEMP01047264.1.p1  ORF type:complete len:293 (+),score=66.39 GEMP01047264.1:119-997(+)
MSESSYVDRFWSLAARTDPRLCFPTIFHGFSIADAQKNPDTDIKRRVVEANCDPTTGEVLWLPVRWGAFAICGAPVVAACVISKSAFSMAAAQGANQTYNATMNLVHRNKSAEVSNTDIAQGYVAATTSSMGIALFLQKITPLKYSYFISFPAVALGNILNTVVMRRIELYRGIAVTDAAVTAPLSTSASSVCGMSTIAAQHAVLSTAVSRAFLPLPVFVGVPILMVVMERAIKRPVPLVVTILLQTVAVQFGIPMTLAMFPEKGLLGRSEVEAHVLERCPKADHFVYDKGL